MKILFLDDQPSRFEVFQRALQTDCAVDFAETYDEAVYFANKYDYDVMFLDHDLNENDYQVDGVVQQSKNGSKFAMFLVENDIKCRTVVLHSLNEYGRLNMLSILKGRVTDTVFNAPFGWQDAERYITNGQTTTNKTE